MDELLDEMESGRFAARPLSRLTAAFFQELDAGARRQFIALVRCMRRDRLRVLGAEVWSQDELDAHHSATFSLSVDLMLITAGCSSRAHEVPALVDALAWCSVFRDLEDDQRKGLNNVPGEVEVAVWTRDMHARAVVTLQQSEQEIARLDDARARRILGIFQSSIEKFARRLRATSTPVPLRKTESTLAP